MFSRLVRGRYELRAWHAALTFAGVTGRRARRPVGWLHRKRLLAHIPPPIPVRRRPIHDAVEGGRDERQLRCLQPVVRVRLRDVASFGGVDGEEAIDKVPALAREVAPAIVHVEERVARADTVRLVLREAREAPVAGARFVKREETREQCEDEHAIRPRVDGRGVVARVGEVELRRLPRARADAVV
eukprot:scaffold22833_cov134-Isochrysis_galbana.AAC.4